MSEKTKPTHEMPGSQAEDEIDDGVVNDSLGTIDIADSTGSRRKKGNWRREEEQHTEAGRLKGNEPGNKGPRDSRTGPELSEAEMSTGFVPLGGPDSANLFHARGELLFAAFLRGVVVACGLSASPAGNPCRPLCPLRRAHSDSPCRSRAPSSTRVGALRRCSGTGSWRVCSMSSCTAPKAV